MAAIHYELHKIIDMLDEDDAENILKVLKKMIQNYRDDTILTPEEIAEMKEGEAQINNGEYMTLQDYKNQRGL
jgi:hypothetical protein